MDIVIPIVFPDYLIHVDTPEVSVDVPDVIPWFDVMPKRVGIPKTTHKIPQLGHAGVLFIEGKTGMTKVTVHRVEASGRAWAVARWSTRRMRDVDDVDQGGG
jgi:hypothetical protein